MIQQAKGFLTQTIKAKENSDLSNGGPSQRQDPGTYPPLKV